MALCAPSGPRFLLAGAWRLVPDPRYLGPDTGYQVQAAGTSFQVPGTGA